MAQLAERFGETTQVLEVGLDLHGDAEKTRARSVLGAVTGVTSISDGARPGDPWHLEIDHGADPAAVRSAVLAAVATEHLPLTSIRAVVPSLEDIYRRAVARPGGSRVERGSRDGWGGARMTSTTSAVEPTVGKPVEDATTPSRARSIPRAGWLVIASKEFGDHILSSRFLVLAIIMTVAAAVPLYFISGQIRDAPSGATGFPALFIALFWLTPSVNDQIQLPSVVGFLALVGPLLGLAFSFDAINGERANGTLPRLLSQPIHRDDVINGKFAAGLGVIALSSS
jgi:hypothetical protein